MGSWIRASMLIAALSFAAACGDSDVVIERGGGSVPAGFFIGETAESGDLSIAVSSIRSVFFRCDGDEVFHLFQPPEPIAGDGSFAVEFASGGRDFTVSGRFVTDDRIEGSIDGDPDCNGDFEARRCDPDDQDCGDDDGDTIPNEVDTDTGGSPTPGRTPTPTGGAATATSTIAGSATPTSTIPTATPSASAGGPTPSATPTPSGLCGNGEIDGDEQCDSTNLDDTDCFDLCEDDGGILTCNDDCTFNFSQCLFPPCELL